MHEMLDLGHIRPSYSPFNSLAVLVKKKDGTLCMCIDYKALNKKMLKTKTLEACGKQRAAEW